MSRPVGTRDKKTLHDDILQTLRDHPEGLNAYTIHKILGVNDASVRHYLDDLLEQKKIIGTEVTKRITLFRLAENDGSAKTE